MKTAISLPDEVFRAAERLAKRLKKSRSELYRDAIQAYLARYDEDELKRIYDELAATMTDDDYAFARAASRRAGRDTWK